MEEAGAVVICTGIPGNVLMGLRCMVNMPLRLSALVESGVETVPPEGAVCEDKWCPREAVTSLACTSPPPPPGVLGSEDGEAVEEAGDGVGIFRVNAVLAGIPGSFIL